jgi:tetratricopeptide (TPR) repeat protein
MIILDRGACDLRFSYAQPTCVFHRFLLRGMAMADRCLRRAAALVFLVAFSLGLGSATARAQSSDDDLKALNQRVGTLYRAGKYAEATDIAKRALSLAESQFGHDNPTVGTFLNNLALLYRDQGRYSEAEPLYKRALAIRENALGPDHDLVGQSLNNLAQLYQDQGRYAEAEPLYKRALAIAEIRTALVSPPQPARVHERPL